MTALRKPRLIRLCERQNWKCYYCRRQMQRKYGLSASATIDHRLPLCRGGADAGINLAACCWRCNQVKGPLTAWEFFAEWPDMSLLPERSPDGIHRRREYPTKERAHLVGSIGPAGCSSKKLPKPPADIKPLGLACLGDLADMRKVFPLHVRLDMAWAALWEHCLAVVDRKRLRQ